MKETTLDQFFAHPKLQQTLSDDEKSNLKDYDAIIKEPIFIKILIGAGAWLASLLIIVFIVASDIVGDEIGVIVLGLFSLVAGLAFRKINVTFTNQLSLAMICISHLLIMFGAANMYDRKELTICLIIHGLLTLILYPLYTSSIYRFFAPLSLGFFTFFWMLEESNPHYFHILVLLQICCIGLLFIRKKWGVCLRPLAYSGLVFLPCLFMLNHANFFDSFGLHEVLATWPSTSMVAVGLILLICHFSPDWQTDKTTRVALLITILLSIFTTPAILVAIGLFILGHGLQKITITVLAYGYMPLSLTSYYYFMGVDLAHKSWIMMASGLLLLGAGFLLGKIHIKQEAPQ